MLAYINSQRPCCKQQEKNESTQHWFPSLPQPTTAAVMALK